MLMLFIQCDHEILSESDDITDMFSVDTIDHVVHAACTMYTLRNMHAEKLNIECH